LFAWLVVMPCRAGEPGDGWTVIGRRDGVVTFRRANPGGGLPSFRGKATVRANIEQVLTLLRDVNSITQWAFGVSRAQLVEQVSPDVDLIYLFSNTPWPLRDRDMTMRRKVERIRPGQAYLIALRCEKGVLPRYSDVIRVNQCESEFRLRKLDEQATEIDYWVTIEQAGKLPKWTSTWVARTVPRRTLVAIRELASRM
jgi:hypothetical protein